MHHLVVPAEVVRGRQAFGEARALVEPLGDTETLRVIDILEGFFELADARVAGMDAALASVLGGLVSSAMICVPTSVGYGAAESGRTALNAMLVSCAPGMTVCNIDNGYGAACAALRILASAARMRDLD